MTSVGDPVRGATPESLRGSTRPATVALIGTPNSGKTSLYNRLTGGRAKVGNYPGVTVERRIGRMIHPDGDAARPIEVVDLPGAYSLAVSSPDETVMLQVLTGARPGEDPPDVLVAVVDATNLRLGMRLVLELRALDIPLVVALNVADLAERLGVVIDTRVLGEHLDATVVRTVATRRGGDAELRQAIADVVAGLDLEPRLPAAARGTLEAATYEQVDALLSTCATGLDSSGDRLTDRLDRVLLHPLLGRIILVAVLLLMFQAVFAWAAPLMDAIDAAVVWLGEAVAGLMPAGVLEDLLVDGIIAGVGSVLVFLPQILILFAFILVLEDSGYLPRASFLLDRSMRSAGLSGRSFIPLLSSFACAIPGIMATRSIPDHRERMVTIFVAPLMTCSARLPVYTLLIAAFIPQQSVLGVLNLQGLTLFVLYAAGIVSAALIARIATRRTLRAAGSAHEFPLLMELPRYRVPNLGQLLAGLWQRARIFLRRVGTVILATSIMLWVLSSYPAPPAGATGPAIEYSFAGRLGHLISPIFAPLGFSWEMSIALIPAMAAREVAVSALGTVYAVSESGGTAALSATLADAWTLPMAFAFLAWFVYAPQCLATIATVRRETNSRRLTTLFTGYLFAAAWLAAFATYHVTSWIVD